MLTLIHSQARSRQPVHPLVTQERLALAFPACRPLVPFHPLPPVPQALPSPGSAQAHVVVQGSLLPLLPSVVRFRALISKVL